jgi:hypothetical protein
MAGVTLPGAMPIGVGCRQRHGVRVLACRCRWRDAQRGPGWTPCKSHGCRKFRGPSTRCPPIGNAIWKPGTLATMQRWANRAAISSGGSAGWSRGTRQSCEPRGARPIAGPLRIGTRGVCCSRDTQITTGSTCGRREARHSRLVIEAVPASRRAGSVPGSARVVKVERPTGRVSMVFVEGVLGALLGRAALAGQLGVGAGGWSWKRRLSRSRAHSTSTRRRANAVRACWCLRPSARLRWY